MKKQFKAESKRMLELMINSVYTHKEIFLRELISNASDAIDKIYYKALTDESIQFNKDDYYIYISIDKEKRQLKISDTGIGMTKDDLDKNLGIIARSGSLDFKKNNDSQDGYDLIGQFGVGFYSAFMVADRVTVISKALGQEDAFCWDSKGAEGYSIESTEKDITGTDVILYIKEDTENETYKDYLDEYHLRYLIKKYSDFIRYPIKMNVSTQKLKEGSDKEYETYYECQVINSMVPIWKKNKNELTEEDYHNFYSEKHYGFDKPLKSIHIQVEGTVSYNAVLYIPEHAPFDYYTKEYEKGLELYSNGVLIMNRCADLLPDHFSFVKGLVDSEDLSLNISREMLQHDRQLALIAKSIKNKIKNELENMLQNEREKYESFYKSFGRQLKYGIYEGYGANKDLLKDLLLFASSKEQHMVTLKEYKDKMPEGQKYIYYACGKSAEQIKMMPQTEMLTEKGYEILFFTDDIDEFAIKILSNYEDIEFKSVSGSDLGIDDPDEDKKDDNLKENTELFEYMKKRLEGRVKDVKASKRLKNHPVCLANEGELSIEMEKILNQMPNKLNMKAEKILEVNVNHEVMEALRKAYDNDKQQLDLYTELLYNQALLIEGLPLENPVEFSNKICTMMK